MNYKEQSQLVTVLRDKFKEPISDDVIKELFDKKNEIAASDVGTSLEFDDFFVEVIVSWIGTDLTSQKANLLIELINSDNGAVDDSEDALLEELPYWVRFRLVYLDYALSLTEVRSNLYNCLGLTLIF